MHMRDWGRVLRGSALVEGGVGPWILGILSQESRGELPTCREGRDLGVLFFRESASLSMNT